MNTDHTTPMSAPAAAADKARNALEAVLLFYSLDWTPEKRLQWAILTGTTEATTKNLCDCVRAALTLAKGTV